MKTFKVIGLLLSYPTEEWLAHKDELVACLEAEGLMDNKTLRKIEAWLVTLSQEDLLDVQSIYADTFDRGQGQCLNLFEHVYGESRYRGQAMADLVSVYHDVGLDATGKELPDYLPLYLEYLSFVSLEQAQKGLFDCAEILAIVGGRLKNKNSPYAMLFDFLVQLADKKLNISEIEEAVNRDLKEDTLEEIDKAWEEAEAFAKPDEPCASMTASTPTPGQAVPVTFHKSEGASL